MSMVNGIDGYINKDLWQWKVGLITKDKKYLTAETFGHKINAAGTTLKKKQTWTLEQHPVEEVVSIKSHLNCYIMADKYGNVTCENTADDLDGTEKFIVEYSKDETGKWGFRNQRHGNYLGIAEEDLVKCFEKTMGEKEMWDVQMSIHPQVNLRNVNRKRFAHLCDDEIQVTEIIPWGQDALIILHFHEGKYSFKTCDNRFLHRNGSLVSELNEDTKFSLEVRFGVNSGLCFKDRMGQYLTAVGATATMRGRNKNVSKDEMFTLADSHPQVVLTAQTGKKVSNKQGNDVSANQIEEEGDKEIFQFEYDKMADLWSIRCVDNTLWSLASNGGIMSGARDISDDTMFELHWGGDGTVSMKASNGKYLANRQTGHLEAKADSILEKEKFIVRIVNRPILILRTEHGFLGFKSTSSNEYVCNKSTYQVIFLEGANNGYYHLRGLNGKYWSVTQDNSIVADSVNPSTQFLLEFRGVSVMTVMAPNGCYLKSHQNGICKAIGKVDPETGKYDASLIWEY